MDMHSIYDEPLPEGWLEEPLGSLVITKRGCSWSKEQERQRANGHTIPVVRIPNIKASLDLTELLYLEGIDADQRSASAVSKGWTLTVGSNGNPKRIGDSVLVDQDREMIFASFLFALRPRPDDGRLTDEFIACWLQAHRVHEFISETSQMTTGLANMSWSACRKLPVRFPHDREEQIRIVNALRAADEQVRALELQIQKAQRVAIALDQQQFAGGLSKVQFPYEYGTERSIRDDWPAKRLGDVAHITSGITLNQDREVSTNGIRYLTVVNVYRGRIDLTEKRYLELKGSEGETKVLRRFDILVVEGHANPAEIGRAALVSNEEEGMSFQNHLFRIRLEHEEELRARFLVRALNAERVRRHWVATAKTSSGLSTINRTGLRRLVVPVPKPTEQDAIVERLEFAEEQIVKLRNQLSAAQRLRKSMVQHLLKGRLRLKP